MTDVGAGAGVHSRATDTHLVLRPHEEDGTVVLDAAVRSWRSIEPTCLRWSFPVWTVDESLDPAALQSERPARKKDQAPKPAKSAEPAWDMDRFMAEFISDQPVSMAKLRETAAPRPGLSWRRVADLLTIAENEG